jgi:hypothetical protein
MTVKKKKIKSDQLLLGLGGLKYSNVLLQVEFY